MSPLFDEQARVGVPQVVEAQAVQSLGQDVAYNRLEVHAVEGAVVERASIPVGEDVAVAIEEPLLEVST